MKIDLKVAAKINLSLNVKGVFPDGYHEIESVMASIDIFDTITVLKRSDGIIRCFMDGNLCDEDENEENTAYKAACLIKEEYKTTGVTIDIKKGIPYNAGLGGSSADAAGVIFAMYKLFALKSLKDLEKIAIKVGCDVPFMMYGGAKKVSGRGEILEDFNCPQYDVIILKGKKGASTQEVYEEFDELKKNEEAQNKENNHGLFINDLQDAAVSLCSNILDNIELLKEKGAKHVLMSGAGSSVYGIFDNQETLEKAFLELEDEVHFCAKAKILEKGIFEIE